MSINVYLTAAEVEQDVTTASVARVLTDAATTDIWANSTSIDNEKNANRIFNVDWSLSKFVPFFQIQFEHNDEDAYKVFDMPPPLEGPDPDMSLATNFDENVRYRINGGAAPSASAGFFDTNSVNLFETPIEKASGGLSTDASSPAGAVVPSDFVAHGYEAGTEDERTAKNLYISDLANTLFGNAGTAELLSNERTIADEIKNAGLSVKNKLDALINDQNLEANSIANKTGRNNSTLIVGKLLRKLMKDELNVDTADRVNAALAKWRVHDPADNKVTDDDGNEYTVWEVNNNPDPNAENVDAADYFNLGSCLRVGDKLCLRVKFTVKDSNGDDVEHGGDGPIVFSAVDADGNPEHRRHPTVIFEFHVNLVA